jgi:hypothetical protein
VRLHRGVRPRARHQQLAGRDTCASVQYLI